MRAAELLDGATLPPRGTKLLVGVSGGLDSVVLAHALAAAGYAIVVGHVHHGLRGESADLDQRFAEQLAADLEGAFACTRLTLVPASRQSLQEAARIARYEALANIAVDHDVSIVAVGHHQDDQAETLLLNLARGSGPAGLGGMSFSGSFPEQTGLTLVRPLLGRSRDELSHYASRNGLAWREDASNADPRYRRNALRNQVVPQLKQVFGLGVMKALSRSARLMRDYEGADLAKVSRVLLDLAAEPLNGRHLSPTGGFLPLATIEALPEVWRHRLVLDALARWICSASKTEVTARRVAALVECQPGKYAEVRGGSVWRERAGLAFVADMEAPKPMTLSLDQPAVFGRFTLTVSPPGTLSVGPADHRVVVDRPGPFQIRAWQAGDRIVLPGGTRKVKALLTDHGVPCCTKATAPVLVKGQDVLWVVGLRASSAFDLPKTSLEGVEVSCCVE